MRTGHLFAGAGGGIYADLILGHQPVFAVEWDNYAAGVLQRRINGGWFSGLHLHHGDVRLFDASQYQGRVDSLHAGFPCQDISVAGNGAGIAGERSGLWSEVVRVAGDLGCREIFLENSPAITGRGLGRVLRDLAELGFDARWCVLPASGVGAPHIRARWWCLARLANASISDFCFDVSDANGKRLHGSATFKIEGAEYSLHLDNFSDYQVVAGMLDAAFRQGKQFAEQAIRSHVSGALDAAKRLHAL